VLKEGIIEDPAQRTRIAKLLRFHSTASGAPAGSGGADAGTTGNAGAGATGVGAGATGAGAGATGAGGAGAAADAADVTLSDYVSRMKPDQKAIYYLTADTLTAARSSPHLEGFRARGLEVLLLTDRIDEWVAAHLHEFEGKTLANVASSAADVASAIETPEKAAAESAYKDTLERLANTLKGKIASAQLSSRLTDSPAVLVAGEFGLSLRMGRILKQAGQSNPFTTPPILEINPTHPLIERLRDARDEAAFGELAHVLYDQAMLAEGGELEDPVGFVRRVNRMLVEGLGSASKIILT
jgi:molecular chaperone HtpG